jgi:hypothetical protein
VLRTNPKLTDTNGLLRENFGCVTALARLHRPRRTSIGSTQRVP